MEILVDTKDLAKAQKIMEQQAQEIADLREKCDKLAGAVKDYDDFVRDLQKYTAKYIEPGKPQITDNEYILSMIGCLDGAKSRKLQSAEAVQIARGVKG